ncbi:MAG: hypothetical protein JO033_20010 [Acidobacteriaceae bacterium]|nr:hypothetical protein [Acidobacteriaceae bacterium]
MRPVKIPGADKGVLFADGSTGELIGAGVRHFFKFEEVDASRFVKLFLHGMKQAAGLSKAGMAVVELVYRQLQEKPNSDEIALSWHLAKTLGLEMPQRTYRHGLRQLSEREFLREPSGRPVFREYPLYVQRRPADVHPGLQAQRVEHSRGVAAGRCCAYSGARKAGLRWLVGLLHRMP